MRQPHDVGGESDGPVDPSDHDKAFWEQRVDAIRSLTGGVFSVDEFRRAREAATDGERTYYERSIVAVANLFLEKGVLSVADLTRKLAEIDAREAGT